MEKELGLDLDTVGTGVMLGLTTWAMDSSQVDMGIIVQALRRSKYTKHRTTTTMP